MSRRKVWESTNSEYRAEAVDRLRAMFPPGSIAATMVRHVSPSGMSRVIAVLGVDPTTGNISNVSHDVARVLGWSYDSDHGGVYVTGCGMDMTFHTVYSLSRTIHAGKATNERNNDNAGYLIVNQTI